MREAFDSIDVDRNGYIDRNEFVNAYLNINPNVSISQLETLFMECDTNDDGVIDFDEVRLFDKSIICFYRYASCCLPLILFSLQLYQVFHISRH